MMGWSFGGCSALESWVQWCHGREEGVLSGHLECEKEKKEW